MSTDAQSLSSEALSRAIREKVAEAKTLQRHLSEAAVRARGILDSLRPTLDEVAAYMYRETGLDVVAARQAPVLLPNPLTDTPGARVAVEYREITVPSEPPVALVGGFQVEVRIDGAVSILSFWAAGDPRRGVPTNTWTETTEMVDSAGPDRAGLVRRAAEGLYAQRHRAGEFLLEALG